MKKNKVFTRPAVERGIPVAVVDLLLEYSGADEEHIEMDTLLNGVHLALDEQDIVEIADALHVEDRCLDWVRVSDVVRDARRRAV